MNRILNAVKLDFFTAKSTFIMSIVMCLVGTAIAIFIKQPAFVPIFVMFFTMFIGGKIFQTQEKNHCDQLYGILPLKRSEMVTARYLYMLANAVVNLGISMLLMQIAIAVLGTPFDGVLYWSSISIAFLFFCFAVGVVNPIYFRFGFTKAYVFIMLPMFLIMMIMLVLSSLKGFKARLNEFISFIADKHYLIPIIGLFVGLLLLAISAAIANEVYKNKEI